MSFIELKALKNVTSTAHTLSAYTTNTVLHIREEYRIRDVFGLT